MTVSSDFRVTTRPPRVKFEARSVEDRNASIAAGRTVYKTVNYVIISQIGSRDTSEKDAESWLGSLHQQPGYRPEWIEQYKGAYERWRSGQEDVPNGTHIRMWAVISKSQSDSLMAAGLMTVEDLANAPEPALVAVGIGARELQRKAREWLLTAADVGRAAESSHTLKAEITFLKQERDTLKMANQTLVLENNRLRAGYTPAAGPAPVAPIAPPEAWNAPVENSLDF